jgi:serine/threonine protein kinase
VEGNFKFSEEPLEVSMDEGHGFLRIEFGDMMGPDHRYRVVRKLGWGMNSSVWMAFDEQYVFIQLSGCCSDKFPREKRYVAIKALTGYSTDTTLRSITSELAALKQLASSLPVSSLTSTHCIKLFSHFIHPGKDHRDHLCLVTEILGGNVKFLQKSVNKAFPLPLAKRILLHTLRGIVHMHSCQIVHTDLKHDNIMFDAGSLTNDDFAALIEADPPRRHHSPEDGTFQAAVSQPLPLPSVSEAMKRTYLVSDFGSGELFLPSFTTVMVD